MNTTTEIEKLTAQKEAIRARQKRRCEAEKKDKAEWYRLDNQIERATAKTLVGKTVVLNPNSSVGHPDLRKLRGRMATVEGIGRKYLHIRFENDEDVWNVGFHGVVLATPENTNHSGDGLLDSLADGLNFAVYGK